MRGRLLNKLLVKVNIITYELNELNQKHMDTWMYQKLSRKMKTK